MLVEIRDADVAHHRASGVSRYSVRTVATNIAPWSLITVKWGSSSRHNPPRRVDERGAIRPSQQPRHSVRAESVEIDLHGARGKLLVLGLAESTAADPAAAAVAKLLYAIGFGLPDCYEDRVLHDLNNRGWRMRELLRIMLLAVPLIAGVIFLPGDFRPRLMTASILAWSSLGAGAMPCLTLG